MVIRLFNRHSLFACFCVLAIVIAATMAVNFRGKQGVSAEAAVPTGTSSFARAAASAVPQASSAAPPQKTAAVSAGTANEMRAVWVPYMSLSMVGESDKSEQAFQKKFDTIVGTAKSCGMNTLIVQVRPFGDALYPSRYYPWSNVVGGTQGVNPGYDPLKDMVKDTHAAGLKIQAWVNPLRIQVSGTPSILSSDSPYFKFKGTAAKSNYVVDWQGGKYYNPAYEEVRRLVADGVMEIVQNYDVDGVQFDDYFYPTQDAAFDQAAYSAYCEGAKSRGTPLSLADWRKANIDAMVSLTYRTVKSVKKDVPFGIAPQGNVQNDLGMGADVCAWCSARGYVDYICPQLYYNFENPTLPFDKAAQTWHSLVTDKDVKLYFGIAVYKAGSDADSGTWKKSSSILAEQIQCGRKIPCDGFMFYSCDYLTGDQTKEEVQNVMKLLH